MKSGKSHWNAPGSPLDGKRVPLDWHRMDPNAKRRALISYGYASDWQKAGQVMGEHSAAMKRKRRTKEEYAAKRRHPEGKD